jgi:hypothetical protein
MNAILRAAEQTVPKATLYRIAAGVALGAIAVALGIAVLRPPMGAVVGYVELAFLAALATWVIAGILRLRLVGFLPSRAKDDDFIPSALKPWILFWLLARLGLLGASMALLLSLVATVIVGSGLNYTARALVYVVVVRAFMDVSFGAALNLGIIVRRRSAS